jgi:hypothetical protein
MTSGTEFQIVNAIERAEEIRDPLIAETLGQKPRLLIENCNPDRTVAALRDTLSAADGLYDRGVPVRLAFDQIQRGTVAQVMSPDALVLMAHAVCRPYPLKAKPDGTISEVNARLPRSFAVMYLDWRGEWRLAPLNGIASAPLLRDDGTVDSAEGHDPVSGMWCENLPNLAGRVSARPTKDDAAAALRLIRETFKTFCFADAETMDDAAGGVATVDTSKAPGRDESSFLVALLTAVCRPSLHLAPGVLLRAPPMSGAGAGKGLLARCICIIAFGREPHAVTAGATAEELEKRIAAELIKGSPALFLELARTLEVHRNSVRHWIKAGLPVIDDKRPILILGADLAEFLWRRRDARRQPCRARQMFCLKCRKPQEPAGRMANFVASSATSGALIGICPPAIV